MKYRTLDEKGDYTLGRRQFLTGRDAVAQAVLTRLRLLYAEWWENTEDGLPLFEKVLSRPGTPDNIRAADFVISQRILGTEGVKDMPRYESTFDTNTRRYSAVCVINTIYGERELTISYAGTGLEVNY